MRGLINLSRVLLLILFVLSAELAAARVTLSDSDTVGVKIYFRQGKSSLDPLFRNNAERLDEFARKLMLLKQDTMCRLEAVRITASFSPEGGDVINGRLLRERGDRLRAYIGTRTGIADSLFKIYSGGIDWAVLTSLVAASNMPDRAMVLGVLQNTPEPKPGNGSGERKRMLTGLSGGRTWSYMERTFFPELRYARVSVDYSRRSIQELAEWKLAHESLTTAHAAMTKVNMAVTDLSLLISHSDLSDDVRSVIGGALDMLQASVDDNPEATQEMEKLISQLDSLDATEEVKALLQAAGRALMEADASLTKAKEAIASAESSLKKAKELVNANPGSVSVHTRTSILLLDNAVSAVSVTISDAKQILDRAKENLSVPRVVAPAPVKTPVSADVGTGGRFRMALKSNLLYDIALVPNIGIEFYLGHGWSIGVSGMYAGWKNEERHHYWQICSGELDLRRYFGRRAAKSPLSGHHLGLYGQAVAYDFETGKTGYQSEFSYGAGVEYGYSLPLGRCLNFDFGIGVGYLGGEYEKYEPVDGHYVWTETKQRHWFGPTKAEVSFVWIIGGGKGNN